MTALITLSHGSRHPRAKEGIRALTETAAEKLGVEWADAHLEFDRPTLAEAAAESERRRRTALVVAAGPAAVPGQVWDQVLVFAGLGGDTATDTAAEGEVA